MTSIRQYRSRAGFSSLTGPIDGGLSLVSRNEPVPSLSTISTEPRNATPDGDGRPPSVSTSNSSRLSQSHPLLEPHLIAAQFLKGSGRRLDQQNGFARTVELQLSNAPFAFGDPPLHIRELVPNRYHQALVSRGMARATLRRIKVELGRCRRYRPWGYDRGAVNRPGRLRPGSGMPLAGPFVARINCLRELLQHLGHRRPCCRASRACNRQSSAMPTLVSLFDRSSGTAPAARRLKTVLEALDMSVDQAALRHIGKLMRRHYDDVASAPLPPQLRELIERLEIQAEAAKSQSIEELEEAPQDQTIGLPAYRTAPA
jgi:hypothetical protein